MRGSLAERLKDRKTKLKHTKTMVQTQDGRRIEEEVVNGKLLATESTTTSKGPGFVIDTKPDLEVARITDRLFVGSQDVAADRELLRSHEITKILNVATGVPCFFPGELRYKVVELLDLPDQELVHMKL